MRRSSPGLAPCWQMAGRWDAKILNIAPSCRLRNFVLGRSPKRQGPASSDASYIEAETHTGLHNASSVSFITSTRRDLPCLCEIRHGLAVWMAHGALKRPEGRSTHLFPSFIAELAHLQRLEKRARLAIGKTRQAMQASSLAGKRFWRTAPTYPVEHCGTYNLGCCLSTDSVDGELKAGSRVVEARASAYVTRSATEQVNRTISGRSVFPSLAECTNVLTQGESVALLQWCGQHIQQLTLQLCQSVCGHQWDTPTASGANSTSLTPRAVTATEPPPAVRRASAQASCVHAGNHVPPLCQGQVEAAMSMVALLGEFLSLAPSDDTGDLCHRSTEEHQVDDLFWDVTLCVHTALGSLESTIAFYAAHHMKGSAEYGDAGRRAFRDHLLCSLTFSDHTVRMAIGSQRRDWQRGVALLTHLLNWNTRLQALLSVGAEGGSKTDMPCQPYWLQAARSLSPASVMSLQNILAHHGRWKECMALWSIQPPHNVEQASESTGPNLFMKPSDAVIALALVNGRATKSIPSALLSNSRYVALQPDSPSARWNALLYKLLQVGLMPNSTPSVPEFATLLCDIVATNRSTGRGYLPGAQQLSTWMFSPAAVWHRTDGHPSLVRRALSLLSFQVADRAACMTSLALEDLYVVLCSIRQFRDRRHHPDPSEDGRFPCHRSLPRVADAPCAVNSVQVELLCRVYALRRAETRTGPYVHFESKGIVRDVPRSEGLLYLVSHELLLVLEEMKRNEIVHTLWEAALGAASSCVQYGMLRESTSRLLDDIYRMLVPLVAVPGGDAIVEPLLRLAPFVSSFTITMLAPHTVGTQLGWEQALRLLSYTPVGSSGYLTLLRHVALVQRGAPANVSFLLHDAWAVVPLVMRNASSRITSTGSASDIQALKVLLECQWNRSLQCLENSPHRVRVLCAPHVLQLVMAADAWREIGEQGLRRLVRLALQGGRRVNLPEMSTTWTVEDVLLTALQHGRWRGGLLVHQLILQEEPDIAQRCPVLREYSSQLWAVLMQKSQLATALARITRAVRNGQWYKACESFMRYAQDQSEDLAILSLRAGNTHTSECDPKREVDAELPALPSDKVSSGVLARASRVGNDEAGGNSLSRAGRWSHRGSVLLELSHLVHTVRYAALVTPSLWQYALIWFPQSTLPLPLAHIRLLHTCSTNGCRNESNVSHSLDGYTSEVVRDSTIPLHTLSVAARTQRKWQHSVTATKVSRETVATALQVLRERGEWESAMLVYVQAMRVQCFPFQSAPLVLEAASESGAPWEVTLRCFAHMALRMRLDSLSVVAAMRACEAGCQWEIGFRVLHHALLTQQTPAPRLAKIAIRTALRSGAWAKALHAARLCQRTRNSHLAHTVLETFVTIRDWFDAMEYFYACFVRGVQPLEESIQLALVASESVSEEYRQTAFAVGAIASLLEDLYQVSGKALEHVVFVHQRWNRLRPVHGRGLFGGSWVESAASPQ